MKSYIERRAESQGHEGKSYMAGWYDALSIEEDHNAKGIFDYLVQIIPLDCEGIIIGLFMSRTYGIEYKLRYYIDGKQYENYFFTSEIKEKK